MAIADNRLTGSSLVNLVTTNFDKAVTATKQSASAKQAVKNALIKQIPGGNQGVSINNVAIGVVDRGTNCNGSTKDSVNTINNNIGRQFSNSSTNCNNKTLYDSYISSPSGITGYMDKNVNINTLKNVATITDKEGYIYKTMRSTPFSKKLDFSNPVNNKYIKYMSPLGGTLKGKIVGSSPMNSCSGNALNSYNPGDNSLFHNLSLSTALDSSSCLGTDKILQFLSELENSGNYNKMDIISSIVTSTGKTGATGIVNKLNLLSSYKSTLSTVADNSQYVQIASPHVKSMVSNIQSDNINSNSPTSDYNNIINGVSNIDPRWNKDNSNNEDYTLFKDNQVMTNLAKQSSSSNSSFTGTPSAIVNTPSSVATKISIVAGSKKIDTPPRHDGSLYDKLIAGSGYGNLRVG